MKRRVWLPASCKHRNPIRHAGFSLSHKPDVWLTNSWRVAAVERPNEMRQLFFARLYFCLQDHPEDAQVLIDRQREVAQKWLADLISPARISKPVAPFDKALLDYRTVQVKMILAWLDDCQAELHRNLKAA